MKFGQVAFAFLLTQGFPLVLAATCINPGIIANGFQTPSGDILYYNGSVIRYHCYGPYIMIGRSVIKCLNNGTWSDKMPRCVAVTCHRPMIKHGSIQSSEVLFTQGDVVRVACDQDYYYPGLQQPPQIKCVKDFHWRLLDGQELAGHCIKECPWPAPINFGMHSVVGHTVTYYCIEGYTFDSDNPPESKTFTCRNSQWVGLGDSISSLKCVPAVKECTIPKDISNGNWKFVGTCKKQVGCQVEYECREGFILLGAQTLTCNSNQLWSNLPPRCARKVVACTPPPVIAHSQRYCQPQSSSCIGYQGVIVNYYCDTGFQASNSNSRIECLSNGIWSGQPHVCLRADSTSPSSVISSNSNTMTVVIATGSSVLGTLLVVIVVVLIRRRRPATSLFPTQSSSPPPYERQHRDSVDEHDRVALIAVTEGVRVVLPSYDDVVCSRSSRSSATSPHHSRTAKLDYRPLPSVPSGIRASGDLSIHSNNTRDDTSSNHPSIGDSVSMRRQSTLTIGTNRDALSENFGSIDTMNVSDVSTAISLGTYDSSASNPSLGAGSHKATAGSLLSHGSEEDDDVPLLPSRNSSQHGQAERAHSSQSTQEEE